MLELISTLLDQRDLSRAQDLFTMSDSELRHDISGILARVQTVCSQPHYTEDSNAQSIVELCLSRVLGAMRANDWIEEHMASLVSLLDACLNFELTRNPEETRPKSPTRVKRQGEADTPHAKIACDLLSCIFNFYENKWVMQLSLPVATRFLLKKNPRLVRTVTSFLRLTANHHAQLLSQEVPVLMQSVVEGRNMDLLDTLLLLYPHNPAAFTKDVVVSFIHLLPKTSGETRLSCLRLLNAISVNNLSLLEGCVGEILAATDHTTSSITMPLFMLLARHNISFLEKHVVQMRVSLDPNWPDCLDTVLQFLTSLARLGSSLLHECLETLLVFLARVSRVEQIVSILVAFQDIAFFAGRWIEPYLPRVQPACLQLGTKGDTLLGNIRACATRNPELYFSSSTQLCQSSVGIQTEPQLLRLTASKTSLSVMSARTNSSDRIFQRHCRLRQLENGDPTCPRSPRPSSTIYTSPASISYTPTPAPLSIISNTSTHRLASVSELSPSSFQLDSSLRRKARVQSAPQDRRRIPLMSSPDLQSTAADQSPSSIIRQFSKRDAMKQFNVKHYSKIVEFVTNFRARLPIPARCSVGPSRRGRQRMLLLHFCCTRNSIHCLYAGNRSFFFAKSRYCRLWLQIMSMAYQADLGMPLGQNNPCLSELRAVYDELVDCGVLTGDGSRHFNTIVNSSFPTAKEQDVLLKELHEMRFFDIFEFNAAHNHWACFLCNHPEKTSVLMSDGLPKLEGRLKEKRGRLRFLKRWKTRYFTLSGAHFSYAKKKTPRSCTNAQAVEGSNCRMGSLSVSSIQSVKAIRRGNRDLPKAFEIFTQDRQCWVLKTVDGGDVASWIKCLQIAVARAHIPIEDQEPPLLQLIDSPSPSYDRRGGSVGHQRKQGRQSRSKSKSIISCL